MAKTTVNEAGQPVFQLSFPNGWTASICVKAEGRPCANALAAWPTAEPRGNFEPGEQEASDEEVAEFLAEVRGRQGPARDAGARRE